MPNSHMVGIPNSNLALLARLYNPKMNTPVDPMALFAPAQTAAPAPPPMPVQEIIPAQGIAPRAAMPALPSFMQAAGAGMLPPTIPPRTALASPGGFGDMGDNRPKAPNLRDYIKDIPDYQAMPTPQPLPTRDFGKEAGNNALGAGLVGLLAAITGNRGEGLNAMSSFVNAAGQTRDNQYQQQVAQAQNANAMQRQAVADANNLIGQRREDAGSLYANDTRTYQAGVEAQQQADALRRQDEQRQIALANQQNDNLNQFRSTLKGVGTGQRRAMIDALSPVQLAAYGIHSPQELYSIADAYDKADQQTAAQKQEELRKKTATADRTAKRKAIADELGEIAKQINSPYFDRSQYPRLAKRYRYLAGTISVPTTPPALPMAMTPGQAASLANADRNYDLSSARFGYQQNRDAVRDQQWQVNQDRLRANEGSANSAEKLDYRTRRNAYTGPTGIDALTKARDTAGQKGNELKRLLASGVDKNGNDLDDGKKKAMQAQIAQHEKDYRYYQREIDQKKVALNGQVAPMPLTGNPNVRIMKGSPSNIGKGAPTPGYTFRNPVTKAPVSTPRPAPRPSARPAAKKSVKQMSEAELIRAMMGK